MLGAHTVELRETIAHALLSLWRKILEARLTLERPLLVRKGEAAMTLHPLRQMLLIGLRTNLLGFLRRMLGVHPGFRRLTHIAHRHRLSCHRGDRNGQQNSQS